MYVCVCMYVLCACCKYYILVVRRNPRHKNRQGAVFGGKEVYIIVYLKIRTYKRRLLWLCGTYVRVYACILTKYEINACFIN